MTDPSTRGAEDVRHVITAVASRTVQNAELFAAKIRASRAPFDFGVKDGRLDAAALYGTYQEVYNDHVRSEVAFPNLYS